VARRDGEREVALGQALVARGGQPDAAWTEAVAALAEKRGGIAGGGLVGAKDRSFHDGASGVLIEKDPAKPRSLRRSNEGTGVAPDLLARSSES
jgi:hypothetical protein